MRTREEYWALLLSFLTYIPKTNTYLGPRNDILGMK